MKKFSVDSLSVSPVIKDFIKSLKDIQIDEHSPKGGNGELFFGKNKILKRNVALKFYYIDGSQMSHAEPELLSQIKHKNILPVDDARIISKDFAYFLSPRIEGGDLEHYISKKNLDTFRSVRIIKGILDGLGHLHTRSEPLIHRDLKPQNILVDKLCNAYIADFGSIVIVPSGKSRVHVSRDTFIYKPPEAISANSFSFSSDLYQAGIVFYQLLGGFFPNNYVNWLNQKQKKQYFEIQGDFERSVFVNEIIGEKIKNGKLIDLKRMPFFIPRKLKRIISKATAVDESKRYQNTSSFMLDIHNYMAKAVNWIYCGDYIYAKHRKEFEFRIKVDGEVIAVEKKGKAGWRKFNKAGGNLKAIADYINNMVSK